MRNLCRSNLCVIFLLLLRRRHRFCCRRWCFFPPYKHVHYFHVRNAHARSKCTAFAMTTNIQRRLWRQRHRPTVTLMQCSFALKLTEFLVLYSLSVVEWVVSASTENCMRTRTRFQCVENNIIALFCLLSLYAFVGFIDERETHSVSDVTININKTNKMISFLRQFLWPENDSSLNNFDSFHVRAFALTVDVNFGNVFSFQLDPLTVFCGVERTTTIRVTWKRNLVQRMCSARDHLCVVRSSTLLIALFLFLARISMTAISFMVLFQ